MNSSPTNTSAANAISSERSLQQRLEEALAEYHEAMDSDRPIDREAFLEKYTDIRHELSGYLDSFDLIHAMASELNDTSGASSSSRAALPQQATLGDFRILREIGRGGMGVVYEAEQISLGRRVALKVLPFAAMLDKQQLARFKNEARAAATLDHSNIVAIYSVGVERSVHFYAMQLIEGQSLAQVVDHLRHSHLPLPPGEGRGEGALGQGRREGLHLPLPLGEGRGEGHRVDEQRGTSNEKQVCSPPLDGEGLGEGCRDTVAKAALSTLPNFSSKEYFRSIAQLGIQAAEALDHAHQNGILHRDIKPANLLLECQTPSPLRGGPGRGADDASHLKLWITDFGLARLEADAGMTMTGDILGTLRYMSPEQALAKRAVVDHRSDIYSLGVTLYELLTLQPAYTGDERQELLRKIAFEDPRSLRQVNARIPQDLATIIQKAIEKEPADRYATAEAMRNDLAAFLENRTIVARPTSMLLRARKLLRRHRPVVLAAAVTLLMAIVVGAVGLFIALGRERVQRQSAQRHLELAREAVDEMLTKVATTWVADSAKTTELQRQFLDRALAIYQQLAAEPPDGDPRGADAAQAHERIADIHFHLGNLPAAMRAWRTAIELYEELTANDVAGSAHSETLVRCFRKLADAHADGSQSIEALRLTESGIELVKRRIDQRAASPELQMELSRLLYGKAKLLAASDQLAEAHDVITKAEDLAADADGSTAVAPDEFELLLRLANLRTAVLCRQERFDEATELNRETVNCMRLVDATLFDSKPMLELRADFQENQADLLLAQGDVNQAVAELRDALRIRGQRLGGKTAIELLMANMGRRISNRYVEPAAISKYCDTQLRLAAHLPAAGCPYEAECMLDEAFYAAEELSEKFGGLQHAVLYANVSAAVADWLAQGRPEESDLFLQLAAAVWNDARAKFPTGEQFCSGLHGDSPDWEWFRTTHPQHADDNQPLEPIRRAHWKTAFWSQVWGRTMYQRGWPLVASRHFANAIQRHGSGFPADFLYLAMTYAELGETEKARAEYEKAVVRMANLPSPEPALESLRRSAMERLSITTSTTTNDAVQRVPAGKTP